MMSIQWMNEMYLLNLPIRLFRPFILLIPLCAVRQCSIAPPASPEMLSSKQSPNDYRSAAGARLSRHLALRICELTPWGAPKIISILGVEYIRLAEVR